MRFVKAKTCAGLLNISEKTWYDWVEHDPTAPKPVIQITDGRRWSRWAYHDVQKYMALLVKEQRTGYVKEGRSIHDKKTA